MSAQSHALVVEGGAMRGIFAAGVLDAFICQGYRPFAAAYGVSAGASNVAAYLAEMEGRNYRVYTDYMRRRQFIRPFRFLLGGHYMDIDWLWDITKAEVPLDVEKIIASPVDHRVVVTRTDTGKADYLVPSRDDLIELLKASSAVPVLYRNYPQIRGAAYADGGVADPIPAERAWKDGARVITVIRSRPRDFCMKEENKSSLARRALRGKPALLQALEERPRRYNEGLFFLRNPPSGCEVREITPPSDLPLDRLTRDLEILDAAYGAGVEAGKAYMQGA
jgi:predicted patatin/cPLA2 family phospholipase